MKKIILTSFAFLFSASLFSQEKIVKKVTDVVTKADAEAHLTFLASDEMRGRDTGSPEIAIAANYIAAQYKRQGLKTVNNAPTYFQEVGLQQTQPPKKAEIKLGSEVFTYRKDLLVLNGKTSSISGDFVFVGYGTAEDFNSVDVKGKIVVSYAGTSEKSTVRQAYRKESPEKYKLVRNKGGVALIEIYSFAEPSWQVIAGFLSGSRISLSDEVSTVEDMPHFWMRKSESESLNNLIKQKTATGSFSVEPSSPKIIPGKNVVGIIEGTDPTLKNEYIVLSAHYDHIGVRKNQTQDSIYNGARDNAMGTTAILEAAKFFSANPVKRSLIILAFCGEEKGLLGSQWYANHPMIPLNQTVYNLDCDGAGYNDKSIITLIDLNRTTADELLKKGCKAFGLALHGDPVPNENLYERSDNYNFAAKGVPAVDFSPGIKTMDEELMKYYHQPPDEVSSLDFDYVVKYLRSYVYASYLIGNSPTRPYWKAGDKFEAAGKTLYGK
ncbi:MAG TPA: hypothetical protein DGG95_07200 [Cytophagales bacterium]|nr:hypothetical protein [Cytophagales bacterium]